MLGTHQLNVFVTAAETLSFTKTAKRLHLTQSSVSQHIKALEGQLGVELFLRKGRTLAVTDAGNVLLPMAREIVEGSIRATERMELIKKQVHGHLIVGCNAASGKYVLPVVCAKFHKQYPLVRITCQVLPQDLTLGRLAEGEVHFAFTDSAGIDPGSAEFRLYLQEPLELIAPKGHRWLSQKEIRPEELHEERFIMREPGSGPYVTTERALAELGIDIQKLNVLLETGASEAIALAVQQGLGVGFVSRMIVRKICRGSVGQVKVRGLDIHQNIHFGRQTVRPPSGAEAAFWEFICGLDTSIFTTDK